MRHTAQLLRNAAISQFSTVLASRKRTSRNPDSARNMPVPGQSIPAKTVRF